MATQTTLHIGHLIKSVFDESGMTVSELARRLHYERTNIYTIFKRRTIDVELLAKLSEALNHNFFYDVISFYHLSLVFNSKLDICIDLDGFTFEQIERLLKMVGDLKEEA